MPVYVYVLLLVVAAVGLAAGVGVSYVLLRRRQTDGSHVLEVRAQQTLLEAETQAKEKLLEAKEEAVKIRTAAEQEAREYRAQSQQIEKRLLQKEENLDHKGEDLNRRERELGNQQKALDDIKAKLEESYRDQEKELQRVANMTRQEAQGILMAQVEQDLRNEVARKVRESELAARDESERRAREIVTESIQRIAADQTAEVSVSVLPLPTDELKGRIIGKEGRNIRALQQATGIDLIVDDTPEAVIISGFDPVRRSRSTSSSSTAGSIRPGSKRSSPSPARRSCRGSRRRGRRRCWSSGSRVCIPRSSVISASFASGQATDSRC